MPEDLKLIKNKYGENMAHLCRELFPTILEKEGLLFSLLSNHFAYSKYLYDDIVGNHLEVAFQDYIYKFINIERKEKSSTKSPYELMREAGYTLYKCETEEEVQSFKKYYSQYEELCTFKGGRLNRCHVFFAVKDNIDEIKRENFPNPSRQDKYGTSVISIQFTKGENNILSIKNRYNCQVKNPDATFSNNLDTIIPGLTKSFENFYHFNISFQAYDFEMPGYVKANDGKFYKYNYEIMNTYYCPNNIIIDNFEVKRDYEDKARYIVLDYFILDLQKKEIALYDNISDSFLDGLQNIERVTISKSKEDSHKQIIINDDIVIEIDETDKIVSYTNQKIKNIGNNFLQYNAALKNISLSNLETVENNFLLSNQCLTSISFPKLRTVGNNFLFDNVHLTNVSLSNLEAVGNNFLHDNRDLSTISFPKLETIGNSFLLENVSLTNISMPSLKTVGNTFLMRNRILETLSLFNLEQVGDYFLYSNPKFQHVSLEDIKEGEKRIC
jgi:hypothetical protein